MWDTRDKELQLRTRMAKLIASKTSGITPEEVTPDQEDYDLADEFANKINIRNEE